MQLPQVNINGTSRGELVKQHSAALNALESALSAMRRTEPHGRDYQTIRPDPANAYLKAMHEYALRLGELVRMINVEKQMLQHLRAGETKRDRA